MTSQLVNLTRGDEGRGSATSPIINGQRYTISSGLIAVAHLDDEWYEDIHAVSQTIDFLSSSKRRVDILTFWQRVPDTKPHHIYNMRWESLAALPITSHEDWLMNQVERTVRNKVRKAQKLGVEVRESQFNDEFVSGMVEIFNESRSRQGRRFVHYGKDFETVKREFSRFLFREELIGAYYNGEMIGFVMLVNAGGHAVLGQFISKFSHRDKATNNLLISKAVEVCASRGWSHLIYGYWGESSLADFKRQSGFTEHKLPRYFVPLSSKGRAALSLGFEQVYGEGWKETLPPRLKTRLKELRKRLLELRIS